MNELVKVFDGVEIRAVICGDENWMIAKDVCDYFGDSHHIRNIGNLDEDEKMLVPIMDSLGRTQQTNAVNEMGLIRLLLNFKFHEDDMPNLAPHIIERRKKVKEFQRWAIHDVIHPVIQDGGVILTTPEMTDAEIMARAVLIGQATIERKDAEIAELKKTKAQISNKREASALGRVSGLVRQKEKLLEDKMVLQRENSILNISNNVLLNQKAKLEEKLDEDSYFTTSEIKWLKDFIMITAGSKIAIGRIMAAISQNLGVSVKNRPVYTRSGDIVYIKTYHIDAWEMLKAKLIAEPACLAAYRVDIAKPDTELELDLY